jgi:hypothetical protein
VCDEKTNESEPLPEASIDGSMVPKPRSRIVLGTKACLFGAPSARGLPACCPGGARCRGGVSSSQALVRNRRTSRPDVVRAVQLGMEPPGRRKGGPQVATTARGRVPMRGTGTGQPVVAMKAL